MIPDLIASVTGTRFGMRSSNSGTQIGTQMERERNANGTQMERERNANGTHWRTRSGRVPNAFSVRLFLSSTVGLEFNNKYLVYLGEISLQPLL